MQRAREFFSHNGFVDKPVTVEEIHSNDGKIVKYILRDGYTRWLVAKENGCKRVGVQFI
jgi:hypothetical protein